MNKQKNRRKLTGIVALATMILVFLLTIQTTNADITPYLHYQGKLNNDKGKAVKDGDYQMQFRLYTSSSGGSSIWSDTQDIETKNGTFSVLLEIDPNDIKFDEDKYYLSIQVEDDSEMSPRKRIASVPQAYNANNLRGDGHIKITGNPEGTDIEDATAFINPQDADANEPILALAVDESQRFVVYGSGNAQLNGDLTTENIYADQIGIGITTPTAYLDLSAATAAMASLRIRSGIVPTTPNTGDIYSDGIDLFYYNGTTWDDLTQQNTDTFTGLTDTPGSYAGNANYLVRVNSNPDGLEFFNASSWDQNASNDLTTSTSWTGDLSGTGSSPTVAKINGADLGITTATPGNMLVANVSNDWTSVAISGDVNISSTGVATIQANAVALGTDVTGALLTANGGTGINGSSAGNGTLLIGNGSGYTLATLTQGTGMIISNASGSITLSTTLGASVDLTSEITGTLPVANGGTGQTTLNDLITLGTHTTGNYVATITAGNGLTGDATGEGSTPILAVGAGDGISVAADTVAVDATTTGTTATTFSNSGLESTSGGVRLLGGCSAAQILKWNSGSSRWECAADVDTDTNFWTNTGSITYLTDTTEDVALGGTNSSASFFFDESAESLKIGTNGSVITPTSVSVGLNAADSGALRIRNNTWLMSRNAANSANLSLIRANTSNETVVNSLTNTVFPVDNEVDDYIYFDATSDLPRIYWEGALTYTNDPGLRVNTSGEMEYRDEDESAWTSFDSLAGGLWTNGGGTTYLTQQSDNLAIGGTDSSAPFFFNEGSEILYIENAIAIGGTGAQSGALRLTNDEWIKSRNAGGGGDIDILKVNASDNLQIGDETIFLSNTAVNFYLDTSSSTDTNLNVRNTHGTGEMNILVEGNAEAGGYLSSGATPAQSGGLRITNDEWIKSRNAGGGGDIDILKVNASNNVQIGDETLLLSADNVNLNFNTARASDQNLNFANTNGSYVLNVLLEGDLAVGTAGATNKYINMGSTTGSGGYGFRDANGTMQFKDSGGSWAAFGSGSGLFTEVSGTPDVTYLTNQTSDLALGGTDSTAPFFFDESAETLKIGSASTTIASSYISIGTNSATAGGLRMGNNTPISFRSSDDNSDHDFVKLNVSEQIEYLATEYNFKVNENDFNHYTYTSGQVNLNYDNTFSATSVFNFKTDGAFYGGVDDVDTYPAFAMANDVWLVGHNEDEDAYINVLKVNDSDQLEFGVTDFYFKVNESDFNFNTYTNTDVDFNFENTFSTGHNINLKTDGAVYGGTANADEGSFIAANNTWYQGLADDNSTPMNIFKINNSDQLEFGLTDYYFKVNESDFNFTTYTNTDVDLNFEDTFSTGNNFNIKIDGAFYGGTANLDEGSFIAANFTWYQGLANDNVTPIDMMRIDNSDQTILNSANNLLIKADGDTDDYIYLDTTSNLSTIYWEGSETNDPGIGINALGELVYRDDNESAWTTFDSLGGGGGSSYWSKTSAVVHTDTVTDDVAIGGTTSANSAFFFDEAGEWLKIGTNAAGSGALRLENDSWITAEASPASTDINMFKVNAFENIQIGDETLFFDKAQQHFYITNSYGNNTYFNFSNESGSWNSFIDVDGGIQLGADPADAGAIRLSNDEWIAGEASPTGTDVNMFKINADEEVEFGDETLFFGRQVQQHYIKTDYGSNTFFNFTNDNATFKAYLDVEGGIQIGDNPADAGAIRLSNDEWIASEGATTTDVNMFRVNSTEDVELGDETFIFSKAVNDQYIETDRAGLSTIHFRNTNASWDVDIDLEGRIQVGSGVSTTASTGVIGLPNAEWITARGTSSDINLIRLNATNDTELGDETLIFSKAVNDQYIETDRAGLSKIWVRNANASWDIDMDIEGDVTIGSGTGTGGTINYLNFAATSGSSGYGFRDNIGTMEYKDSGGSWTALNTLDPGVGSSGGTSYIIGSTNDFAVGGTDSTAAFFIDESTNTAKLGASGYLNYGATVGLSGYGLRDNSGVIEYKDSAGSWTAINTLSSLRFKEDVEDIDDYIDTENVFDLRPVKFTWIETQKEDIGLIAEEVYEIMPDLVNLDQNGDPYSIKYHLLGVLLLNEMQKDRYTLNTIESTISDLEDQIAQIQDQLNQDLNLAQIDANSQDIEYINDLLGIERVAEPGDVDILGRLTAKEIQTGETKTYQIVITNEIEDAPTVGTEEIPAGKTKVMVETEVIKEDSKIFVTLKKSSKAVPIQVSQINESEGFEVEIGEELEDMVEFDWWIIKEED